MPAGLAEHNIRCAACGWLRVCDNYRAGDQRETRHVINIITQVDDVMWINLAFLQQILQERGLIFHTLHILDLQFPAARGYYRVCFG